MAFLGLLLMAPPGTVEYEFQRAAKHNLLVCHGVPVPEGDWAAIYHPQSRIMTIAVYRWSENRARHVFIGWADDRDAALDLLRRKE